MAADVGLQTGDGGLTLCCSFHSQSPSSERQLELPAWSCDIFSEADEVKFVRSSSDQREEQRVGGADLVLPADRPALHRAERNFKTTVV